MEKVYLDAQIREQKGKEAVNALRKQNQIPAVVYGMGGNTPLSVDHSSLVKLLHQHSAESTVITLKIQGSKSREANVLIKELQRNPVSQDVQHVDFYEISLTKAIQVHVPLELKGEPEGVKHEDGALEHNLWELEIECLPTQIPEDIQVDVSHLKLNESLHVSDLTLPEGVKVINDPEQIIASVKPPKEEKEEEQETEEGEEGAAEPEVIKQKSEEEIAKEQAEKQQEKQEKEKEE